MIILGVDPALANCGWGVVTAHTNSISFLAAGSIKTAPKSPLESRLQMLFNALCAVCKEYNPQAIAFEETFVNNNPASALKLGLARGALITAAAQYTTLPITYYAPNVIKKALTGHGHASKDQMQHMIKRLLPTSSVGSHDEADALAIALCDALSRRF